MSGERNQSGSSQNDLIDDAMSIPVVNAGVTRLQRFLGPSCLVAMVIFLILTVMFRRWVKLPWPGMVIMLIIVWLLVLGLMVRIRNIHPDGDYIDE